MDVVTGGELAVAKASGFPAERLNFHGNNKTPAGTRRSHRLRHRPHHRRLFPRNRPARRGGPRARRGPAGDAPSIAQRGPAHAPAHDDWHSRFQVRFFHRRPGDADKAVRQAMAARNLEVDGLHFHLGSPIFELEPYSQAVRYVLRFAAEMRQKHGLELRHFNPGGGFAIGYVRASPPPPIAEYASEIAQAIREGCDANGLDLPRAYCGAGPGNRGPGRRGRVQDRRDQAHTPASEPTSAWTVAWATTSARRCTTRPIR